MKANTPDLLKFKRLQRRLKLSVPELCGYLELLWISTAKNAPEGDIGRFTNEEIAIGCYWNGDVDEFVEALVDCGWLDKDDTHRLLIHDWDEHAPSYVRGFLKRHNRDFVKMQPSVQDAVEDVNRHPAKQPTKHPAKEAAIAGCYMDPASKPSQAKPSQAKPSERADASLAACTLALSPELEPVWETWKAMRLQKHNAPIGGIEEEAKLMELSRCYPSIGEQLEVVQFSIAKGAKHLILNGDHRKREGPTSCTTKQTKLEAIRKETFSK